MSPFAVTRKITTKQRFMLMNQYQNCLILLLTPNIFLKLGNQDQDL